MKKYVPLHGHSTFSIGDGVAKIEEIIQRAKEIGAPAIALTEHGNMSSFLKFYNEAKKNDINPIIGIEYYVNDLYFLDREKFKELRIENKNNKKNKTIEEAEDDLDEVNLTNETKNNHQVAYARNYKGVQNLLYLSNLSYENDNYYYKPLVSLNNIYEKLDDNNIITTGCLNTVFNRLILLDKIDEFEKLAIKFQNKFKDNFYFEIQINKLKSQKKCNDVLFKYAKKLGIKTTIGLDYHYVHEEDWYLQYILYLIKQRSDIESMSTDDWFYDVRDLYIKSYDQVLESAEKLGYNKDDIIEALDNTLEFNEKVNIELNFKDNYPKYMESKKQSTQLLLEHIKNKFEDKIQNGIIPNNKIKEYQDRLKYELKIIMEKDFGDYFLIFEDIVNFVQEQNGMVGVGRGSAGGSLLSFILDIIKIDPIKNDLIFERFLNPDREDPPDIDIDIDSITHEKIEEYLRNKYGNNKVCHIANFIKFSPKLAIKDLSRVHKLDFGLSNQLTELFGVGSDIEKELKNAINIAEKQNNYKLVEFINQNYNMFVKWGNKLNNMIRNLGRHASGILISNNDLRNSFLPLAKVKGETVTGIQEGADAREISDLGYLKLDILGLNTAAIINQTIKLIEKRHDIKDVEKNILYSNFDDPKVYEQFKKGNSRDIFQFGSDNMINLILKVQPENIEDLCAINALWRPAIIYAGGIDNYLKGRKSIDVVKDNLIKKYTKKYWDITKSTFGMPLYQEQIMFIFQKIGNFTLAEADKTRKVLKILDKKKNVSSEEEQKKFNDILNKFYINAQKNNLELNHIDELIAMLTEYSSYSFNRSHSFAYAVNAYITMWLKVYYPKEYFVTLLNYSNQDELSWFIKQTKSYGIKFNDFKLGNVGYGFEIDDKNDSIKIGLNCVKGINKNNKKAIIESNIEDYNLSTLIDFIRINKISKSTFVPLTKLKFFKDFHENSKFLKNLILESYKLNNKKYTKESLKEIAKKYITSKDYSKTEFNSFERELLNFYIDEHPFILIKNLIEKEEPSLLNIMQSPKQLENNISDGEYMLYGILNKMIIKKTKNKKEYYRLLLEDDIKQININVWDIKSLKNINEGDFIILKVEKGKFGFAKNRWSKIEKLNI